MISALTASGGYLSGFSPGRVSRKGKRHDFALTHGRF